MADITDKKGKKLEWYKYVVKRYLRDILQDLANLCYGSTPASGHNIKNLMF